MSQYTKDKANDTQGGRLTGADIQKEFGQHYHSDSIYYLLDHMGFSWITSRSPPKQSQLTQEDLKNSKSKRSLKSQKI
ncbi:TPA: winged helix-turn-helix domain-containing protein [Vibrio parahaemolyticus]|uniref:helix-turn-helix domain-containing protein n=1 Tax=Vibrio parahaemolyticus TaxID=670 RepID=UPI0009B09DAB|nr:winged helix-turn-helix domain-containing protein [Vibrio parahaemolyticus]MBY3751489.1 winged helix-turn-helix domain-containing protein [Vibrio parahaemolyticus]MBY3762361.1 winged helix-turn-helix domain-containing protein [Vibrio parahaemolyticus]MBY3762810.1 winged helix-turn-helix domain-containing protein [Vibrio parahaemolyticus]MBY3772663.1 winged helix-turn-helix domain-containing protein [Vibrio parahaemolyticus]MBY3781876.1 winged helix-turn-helix domain-containing protein [Vibr